MTTQPAKPIPTIYWAPLLHFYQPPMQLPYVLRKVVNESYRPLLDVFQEYPHARITVNINAVLTEMLFEHGYQDVLDRMRALAAAGRLEFTGSGKYHPILPLIPRAEMERQIRRNYLTNRHFFGDTYDPCGFFPPELCYSEDIIESVVEARHRWLLASGIACPVAWPTNIVHEVGTEEDCLAIFFRDDILSNKISFQGTDSPGFVEILRDMGKGGKNAYVVTAMDAETFGHHIQSWERLFLAEVYEALEAVQFALPRPKEPDPYPDLRQNQPLAREHRDLLAVAEQQEVTEVAIRMTTISELIELFPRGQRIAARPSSWSTTIEDIQLGNPYPLWQYKDNYIHKLQWQHVELCLKLVYKAEELADNPRSQRFAEIARALMDEALHSCQFWWASKRPMWDVNMVSRGLMQQREVAFNAFKAINVSNAPEPVKGDAYYVVVAARDTAHKILDQLFWD